MKKGHAIIIDYNKRSAKKYIQNRIIEQNSNMQCDLLTLLGPTPKSYLLPFFEYDVVSKDSLIFSYENNINNYLLQLSDIETMSYRRNIIPNFSSIENASNITRYIDLDFCNSLEGRDFANAKLINNLFNKQKNTFVNTTKVFNFTLSMFYLDKGKDYKDNYISNDICKFLSKLLKCEVKVKGSQKLKEGIQYYIYVSNMQYEIQIYYYFDSFPMLNIYIKSFS